jgi:hypothetical protein
MKQLCEQLRDFKTDLEDAFENEESTEQLDEMLDEFYFDEIICLCSEVTDIKEIMKDFGYEL